MRVAEYRKSFARTMLVSGSTLNVGFGYCDAGPLHPIGGHGPSHLDERRAHWPSVLRQRVIHHDLLHFHIVGHEPIRIDAPLNVPGASMVPAPSCNDDDIEHSALEIDI